jgi:Zn ribbon nucleic-acid-binding protein
MIFTATSIPLKYCPVCDDIDCILKKNRGGPENMRYCAKCGYKIEMD